MATGKGNRLQKASRRVTTWKIPGKGGYSENLPCAKLLSYTLLFLLTLAFSLAPLRAQRAAQESPDPTNVQNATAFAGADAGAKIAACIAALPSTGGTCDARGLDGAQTVAQNMFLGLTKPVLLLLPSGTYSMCVGQTILTPRTRIVGIGSQATIFQATAAIDMFTFGDGAGGHQAVYSSLENLTVNCNSTGTKGVVLNGAGGFLGRNLFVTYCTGNGIEAQGTATYNNDYVLFEHLSSMHNGGKGYQDTGGVTHAMEVQASVFNANTGGGFWHGSNHLSFEGSIEQNGDVGLMLAGYSGDARYGADVSVYSEGNTGKDLQIGSGGSFDGVNVHGSTFFGGGTTAIGVYILNGNGFQIAGNNFSEHTTSAISVAAGTTGNVGPNKCTSESAACVVNNSAATTVWAPALKIVTFSSTPTFDISLGSAQKITLTGNVSSSTLSNAYYGQKVKFIVCQDGSGSHTFVWPKNVKGAMTVGATASTCSAQSFIFDGTNAYATGAGVTDQ